MHHEISCHHQSAVGCCNRHCALVLGAMADLEAKKAEINLVLSAPDVDLWKLRELCLTEGGLVDGTSCFVAALNHAAFNHSS